jgi:haloalkane dehalogenase
MWEPLLDALTTAGWRGVAPDLMGFGDSPVQRPATWSRHVEALTRFAGELALRDVVLIVHDWGGLIGLRWACDVPGAARALIISDTGFFADGTWHGLADMLRTPGAGEQFVDSMTRPAFGNALTSLSPNMTEAALDHYFKIGDDHDRRRAQLDLYRSGDFAAELGPYEGRLAALAVPALLLWGAEDPFVPVTSARRLEAELPDTELVVLDGLGHFIYDDAPDRTNAAVLDFLARRID